MHLLLIHKSYNTVVCRIKCARKQHVMKMRKKIVVGGTIVLVVGTLLLVYGSLFPPRETLLNDMDTIQSGIYRYYWVTVPSGESVNFEYSTSDEVEFLVLDSDNFELLEAYENFDPIFISSGRLKFYALHAPKDDRYYVVLLNSGYSTVTSSVKISREVSGPRFVWLAGVGLSVIGCTGVIVGLTLKPKITEFPQDYWIQPNVRQHDN